MSFLVGYTVDDVMYRWTEGDGCNIEPDLELSQFDIGEIKINTTTTDINKGKQIFSDIVWNTRIRNSILIQC